MDIKTTKKYISNKIKIIVCGIIFFNLVVLFFDNGILKTKFDYFIITKIDNNFNYKNYLPSDFVDKNDLTGKHGDKIILILSLESFEKKFIDDPHFKEITPNFQSIKQKYNIYPMQESEATWTSGSLFSLLLGLKPYYKSHDNQNAFFYGIEDIKIPSLSDILQSSDYDLTYLMADPEYSGTDFFLKALNFKIVKNNENNKYFKLSHDKDLFDELKNQLLIKSNDPNPSAIFVSTMDTHFPDGIYDKRLESFLNKDYETLEDKIDFSISALDYLVGDLFKFLEQNNLINKIAIFLLPDHKFMGKSNKFLNSYDDDERELFLITNKKLNLSESINQQNIGNYIITSSNLTTNGKLISAYDDFELNETADNFKKNLLMNFNYQITKKSEAKNLKFLYYKNTNNKRVIKVYLNDYIYKEFLLHNESDYYHFVLNNSFVPIYSYQPYNNWVRWRSPNIKNPVHILIKLNDYGFEYATIGDSGNFNFINHPDSEVLIFTEDQLNKISKNFPVTMFERNFFNISLTSAHIEKLIEFKWNIKYCLSFLNEYRKLKIRELKNFIRSLYISKKEINVDDFLDNDKRFIAHAGGAIGGFKYTNSLEALNQSYNKGYRLFELDLIQTSDDHFVAAHDWQHWKKISGFKGSTPVSKKDFLENKIYEKFTPLDMNAINNWFEKHEDAFLVTDKINSPDYMFANFRFKDRLIMELFSIDAVNRALDLGITPMPNINLWLDIKYKNKNIYDNINFISASIHKSHPESIKEINLDNKKIFAYHLNTEIYDNEIWTLCSWRNKIFGFYVDNLDFKNEPILCD